MKALTNEQYEQLVADSNRLQAIIDGKLVVMPTPRGLGWIVERHGDTTGLSGTNDRNLRVAIDSVTRVRSNG
jgi:hypothetical protein